MSSIRSPFTATAALLLVVAGAFAAPPAASPQPDVVFFLVDDLGWTDVGCYGSSYYETSNIDRLAAEGVRFTDAYTACHVYSPTRASISNVKYPWISMK